MRALIIGAALSLAITTQTYALTFKKGEVLGPDGEVHQGASPDQMDRLVEKAKETGDVGGVTGNNVFVVVGENVTFIPINDLSGLPKETQIAIVGDAVVQDLTGNDDITYEQVNAVTELSEETGVSVEEILNDGDLAGIDPDIMKQIEAVSAETGISIDNLVAVNSVIEAMPQGEAHHFMEEIGDLIEDGMADQIDAFLTDLREDQAAWDAFSTYSSLDDCLAGGGGEACERANDLADEHEM